VRLKGGDPFVFGRGGEEAQALVAAGVPFRVVPGITAGVGALAYAGIPTTHRDTNAAVTFVTGHGAGGDLPDGLDWEALARGSPVLVVYMAVRHLPEIAARLAEAGRDPGTPVAIVSRGTLPGQRVVVTTLARAAHDAEAAGLEPPAVVAIGEVVRLRAALDWLGAAEGRTLEADPLGAHAPRRTG
jgi:uroporphyrin-III C-methyltransferase